jgi:acyl carrier protein
MIEERFKLQIPDQDLPGLSTVGTVAAYVQRRLVEPKTESKPESAKPATAASKSKSTKSTTTKTTKPSSTKQAAPSKPTSAGKPKKAATVRSGKKKVAAR